MLQNYHNLDPLPPFAIDSRINTKNISSSSFVQLLKGRRKRCTCGCSGCDLFPNRQCCGPSCCSNNPPLPLACCLLLHHPNLVVSLTMVHVVQPIPATVARNHVARVADQTCTRSKARSSRNSPQLHPHLQAGLPPKPVAHLQCQLLQKHPSTPTCPPEPPIECCAPKLPLKLPIVDVAQTVAVADHAVSTKTLAVATAKNPVVRQPALLSRSFSWRCWRWLLLQQHRSSMLKSLPHMSLSQENYAGRCQEKECACPSNKLHASKNIVEKAPHASKLAGGLYSIPPRHKRDGVALLALHRWQTIQRTKRSTDCVPCTYLQPGYANSSQLPYYGIPPSHNQSPVPIRPVREKRDGCLPHPVCLALRRRSKRNHNQQDKQYCEACPGGYLGRRKREAEQDQCVQRKKREQENCGRDDHSFTVSRMKRQSDEGGVACVEYPACILSRRRRRKRHVLQYYHQLKRYHHQLKAHKQLVIRHKRQFFTPDAATVII
uniref:Uncharacterized protein n=1 Tax=Ditylenchus dipsaci TaxID=166011 RepID=A0A915EJ42_9BILA